MIRTSLFLAAAAAALAATPASARPMTAKDMGMRLVEAVRGLALRHGPAAVEHCVKVVTDLRKLLDTITGT